MHLLDSVYAYDEMGGSTEWLLEKVSSFLARLSKSNASEDMEELAPICFRLRDVLAFLKLEQRPSALLDDLMLSYCHHPAVENLSHASYQHHIPSSALAHSFTSYLPSNPKIPTVNLIHSAVEVVQKVKLHELWLSHAQFTRNTKEVAVAALSPMTAGEEFLKAKYAALQNELAAGMELNRGQDIEYGLTVESVANLKRDLEAAKSSIQIEIVRQEQEIKGLMNVGLRQNDVAVAVTVYDIAFGYHRNSLGVLLPCVVMKDINC